MRILKQEIYFPIIVGIHFIFWAIDLYFYEGSFKEVHTETTFGTYLDGANWKNPYRILGEVFSTWVVTVFAFNFLMATRARWIENLFGGLDKMYLIHRRSGTIAVLLMIAHVFIVPKTIDFHIGIPLGAAAFFLILFGVLLAALPVFKRKLPYHKWINVHKLMGLFYTIAIAHAFVVDSLILELPITRVYVFGMAMVGIFAWIYKAFLFNLNNKKLNYSVKNIKQLGNEMIEIEMESQTEKLKYVAGQFAFFTFPSISKKEQHPFTLSSHPHDENLKITIKGLGDYTNKMLTELESLDKVLVEGPYGKFSSSYSKEREQVWIAGGIGITPFLSLIKDYYTNKVTLFWCVNNLNEAPYKNELEKIASQNPLFEFVLWDTENKGHLSFEDLSLREPKEKSYLICGPEGLKKNITKELKKEGVKHKHIYDEEFAFR